MKAIALFAFKAFCVLYLLASCAVLHGSAPAKAPSIEHTAR